jgi:Arc/MetJ-type ribon-helix-helix transcriptional regulator
MVQIPRELIERLDRRAAREAVSRSEVIRRAIKEYLATDASEDLAALYANAYSRHPLDEADEWGDLASWLRGALGARPADDGRVDW